MGSIIVLCLCLIIIFGCIVGQELGIDVFIGVLTMFIGLYAVMERLFVVITQPLGKIKWFYFRRMYKELGQYKITYNEYDNMYTLHKKGGQLKDPWRYGSTLRKYQSTDIEELISIIYNYRYDEAKYQNRNRIEAKKQEAIKKERAKKQEAIDKARSKHKVVYRHP